MHLLPEILEGARQGAPLVAHDISLARTPHRAKCIPEETEGICAGDLAEGTPDGEDGREGDNVAISRADRAAGVLVLPPEGTLES